MAQWFKKDLAATKEARKLKRFLDSRSYLTLPRDVGGFYGQHEKLFGKDMQERRKEIFGRMICAGCHRKLWVSDWPELDHIVARGRGGCDCKHNLQVLCANLDGRGCHQVKHLRRKRETKA